MELWQPDLVLRRTALAEGWADDELDRRQRTGELSRIRPGAYVATGAELGPELLHRRLITATLAALRRPAVVSHQSAAVLHGLPLWGVRLDRVHVTRRPPASSDVGRYLRCHVARLPEGDVVEVDGIAVTGLVRTLLDLARVLPFESSVALLDGALFRRVVDPAGLAEGLAGTERMPGARAATRAVRFADGRSESVGESRSRVLLHRLGLAPSTLQLEVRTPSGAFVGRSDFGWEGARLLGEFDGRVKYGRLLRPGQSPGDAVFEEKRREDALRDEDWGVVRWTWSEIAPDVLGPRVHRGLERGRRRRA